MKSIIDIRAIADIARSVGFVEALPERNGSPVVLVPMTAVMLKNFAHAVIAEFCRINNLTGDLKGISIREHITDGSPCWCSPELDYKDPNSGIEVWVHKEPQ